MKLGELIQVLQQTFPTLRLSWCGETDLEIEGIAPISQAQSGTISYIEGLKYGSYLSETQATALVVPQNEALQAQVTAKGIAWIGTDQPRLVFAQVVKLFYQPFQPSPGVHPTAVLDPTVVLGEGVYIGPYVVIQAGTKIGNGVYIHPNVVIYPQVGIGDRTLLHANCTIHERSQIGSDCVIHSGVVIGGEGFGFVPTAQGWFKMEQAGYVVLEDGVEVGSNSTIDRPAMGITHLGRNTKLDNLVHVGHGCEIGENCALAAQVGLAGGVKLGNQVILAGQVGVANQVKLGDGAIASSKSGIHSDVEPGVVVSGYPAIANRLWLKTVAVYNQLPDLYKTVKQLQRQLDQK
jgi:UDP-3-O-[3-hydroxymyristoyl] glucosamine N-acyltransferase